MKERTKCSKCGSKQIKTYENENGYLPVKPEGITAEKYKPIKKRCFCWKCENDWECEEE